MKNLPQIPDIPEEEQTPLVNVLPGLPERQSTHVVLLEKTVAGLKDQINIFKEEKKRSKFKPSAMGESSDDQSDGTAKPGKRAGSKKKSGSAKLKILEDVKFAPSMPVSQGSRFKGYRDFNVQDLIISAHNTRYRYATLNTRA